MSFAGSWLGCFRIVSPALPLVAGLGSRLKVKKHARGVQFFDYAVFHCKRVDGLSYRVCRYTRLNLDIKWSLDCVNREPETLPACF